MPFKGFLSFNGKRQSPQHTKKWAETRCWTHRWQRALTTLPRAQRTLSASQKGDAIQQCQSVSLRARLNQPAAQRDRRTLAPKTSNSIDHHPSKAIPARRCDTDLRFLEGVKSTKGQPKDAESIDFRQSLIENVPIMFQTHSKNVPTPHSRRERKALPLLL